MLQIVEELFKRKLTDSDLTWDMVTEMVNEKSEEYLSKDHLKRAYYKWLDVKGNDRDKSEEQSTIDQKILELKKLKAKISDERIQDNAYIRRLSREETLKDIAMVVAEKMATVYPLELDSPKSEKEPWQSVSADEAILQISDWHYGLEFTNAWNSYSPEITKSRIEKLYQKTIEYCTDHDIHKLHVVNLSDLIAGRIHLGLRLESRFDVVTQTMEVAEILANFISRLAKKYYICYYDCIDNHSRVEPIKGDSMNLESFVRFIPWYLRARLQNLISFGDVKIINNKYGEDIITFTSCGHKILGVHGDRDNANTLIEKLSLFTKEHYDLMLSAHRHHFSADETCDTLVVANGSLMGTDTYAKNLRLNSKPSQNLIICSTENPAKAIYRITLD